MTQHMGNIWVTKKLRKCSCIFKVLILFGFFHWAFLLWHNWSVFLPWLNSFLFQFLARTWQHTLWAVWRRASHWLQFHQPTTPTTLCQVAMHCHNIVQFLRVWSLLHLTYLYLQTITSVHQAVTVATPAPDQPPRCLTSVKFMVSF